MQKRKAQKSGSERVCGHERAEERHAEFDWSRKWKRSAEWPWGVRKQDSSTLTAKAALLPSSYRTERGSGPPGKGINQDLQEPKPDKHQSIKIKTKHGKAKKNDAQSESKPRTLQWSQTKYAVKCMNSVTGNSKENAAKRFWPFHQRVSESV